MEKTFNSKVKIVKNPVISVACSVLLAGAALLSTASSVVGQTFYVAQGPSGKIGAATSAGVPSTFADFPAENAQGITTDSLGNVYAAVGSTIHRITPAGSSSVFATYTNPILGLTMSSSGTLYGVSSPGSGSNDVGTFDSLGNFTPLSLTSTPFLPFYSANGLKFDSAGNLFVANAAFGGEFAHSVVKLTPSGADWNAAAFATFDASSSGLFDVVTDPAGNVYVSAAASSLNDVPTIYKLDSAGVQDNSFTLSGIPDTKMTGLTFENGSLYAVSFGTFKIWEIDPDTGVATDFLGGENLPDFRSSFITATAVPEPSVVGLLILGGLGFLVVRRKLNRSALTC